MGFIFANGICTLKKNKVATGSILAENFQNVQYFIKIGISLRRELKRVPALFFLEGSSPLAQCEKDTHNHFI